MTWWASLLGTLALVFGGVVGARVNYLLGRRKASADADQSISKAAASIAEAGDAQVKRMTLWLEQASLRADAALETAARAKADLMEVTAELVLLRVLLSETQAQMVVLRAQLEHERAASRIEISRLTRAE